MAKRGLSGCHETYWYAQLNMLSFEGNSMPTVAPWT